MVERSSGGWQGRGKRRGDFGGPKRAVVQLDGPVQLITNNFRMKQKNHGIIYTYSVDFVEVGSVADKASPGLSEGGELETYLKFKIFRKHDE